VGLRVLCHSSCTFTAAGCPEPLHLSPLLNSPPLFSPLPRLQYLDKQAFLKQAELREYEKDRDRRLASDVRNRGRL
jgi:hypothetical protein